MKRGEFKFLLDNGHVTFQFNDGEQVTIKFNAIEQGISFNDSGHLENTGHIIVEGKFEPDSDNYVVNRRFNIQDDL